MPKVLTEADLLVAFKESLKAVVKSLNSADEKPDVQTRVITIEKLIEAYINETGVRPDDYQLYAMGSYLLDDYLTDQYKHHRKDEHPFQTDARVKKNHARQRTVFIGDRTDFKST